MAAYQGSQEAKDIKMKRIEEAYKEMYKAQYELKEVRRKNADPNKLESYTERDPDGTIRRRHWQNNLRLILQKHLIWGAFYFGSRNSICVPLGDVSKR